GSGDDVVNVTHQNGNLDLIRGDVLTEGAEIIDVDDHKNTLTTTYSISDTSLARSNSSATAQVSALDATTCNVTGGSGGDTFTVDDTAAGTTTTLTGGTGDDQFLIAPTGKNLDAIRGVVSVNGEGGFDRLSISDDNNAVASSYSLTFGAV